MTQGVVLYYLTRFLSLKTGSSGFPLYAPTGSKEMLVTDYVGIALFVYTLETDHLIEPLQKNLFGVKIIIVAFDVLMEDPEKVLEGIDHLVVSGPLSVIKKMLDFAMKYDFSVGIIPMNRQNLLIKCFALPQNTHKAIDLALKKSSQVMDIILCNQHIMLFQATLGRLPLMDSPADISKINMVVKALKKFVGLELTIFNFTIAGQKKIRTAACGCMMIQRHEGTFASKLIANDSSFTDGMISMLVSAPRSIIEYFIFLTQAVRAMPDHKNNYNGMGYIKSACIDIESERLLDVHVDGEHVTHTPIHCETIKEAVRLNIGEGLREENGHSKGVLERINTENLPIGKELFRVKTKRIPFFSYASEERFRDLFAALRIDSMINSSYLMLMLLSTLLATLGLYLDSGSVVIGAMLLAPLMAPIVSLAMGILRQDEDLSKNSIITIITGVVISLVTAALIALIYPYESITSEMAGRLHPSLLDLSVAIIAGMAAAYTKSYKEIIQSLAGVAIAVALVPPLAVAGIGIGRWDSHFFGEAFLLFGTNLIGIVLAATFTFRVLGYSPAIKGKRGIAFVFIFLALISIPLSLSFNRIVENRLHEKSWQEERFLVNEKYLIVKKAEVQDFQSKKLVTMDVLTREPLTRDDLTKFKRKIQTHFARKLIININVIYIP